MPKYLENVRFGNTGLKVPPLIVGGMSWGSKTWRAQGGGKQEWILEEEETQPILDAYFENGLFAIDVADVYSAGRSEEILGNYLEKKKINREAVVILTKLHGVVPEDPAEDVGPGGSFSGKYANQGGQSRKHIFAAVDASLKRLKTPYIDVLQIHRFDPSTPPEETMKALHDVVESGKVHYLGASSMFAYQFLTLQHVADKNGWTKFISLQQKHSAIYREEERELMPYCLANGIALIPWSATGAGALSRPLEEIFSSTRGKDRPEFKALKESPERAGDREIIKVVEQISKKKGCTMTQVAIAYSIAKGNIPILGMSSVDRIKSNIDALKIKLTKEELAEIEAPYRPKPIEGHF